MPLAKLVDGRRGISYGIVQPGSPVSSGTAIIRINDRPDEVCTCYQLTDLRDTLVEIARNKQTTGLGHVTVEDMKRLHVIHPASEVMKAFADPAGPIYDQSFTLSVDSLTLERTRDKLLPNLLAGTLTLMD